MLGLKLNHASKRGSLCTNDIEKHWSVSLSCIKYYVFYKTMSPNSPDQAVGRSAINKSAFGINNTNIIVT